jgi:ADP-ribose pyrophosphatase
LDDSDSNPICSVSCTIGVILSFSEHPRYKLGHHHSLLDVEYHGVQEELHIIAESKKITVLLTCISLVPTEASKVFDHIHTVRKINTNARVCNILTRYGISNTIAMIKDWDLIDSKVDRDYRVFKIKVDTSLSPRTKKAGEFYVIDTNDWVNIIPITEDGQVVMIKQFRHGSKKVTLEIPGGLVDDESPEKAALRELLEETGYQGDGVTYLGATNPNPAIFNNLCHTFLVENVKKVSDINLDDNEDIEVVLKPLAEVPSLIAEGNIDHALVIIAFHFFFTKQSQL